MFSIVVRISFIRLKMVETWNHRTPLQLKSSIFCSFHRGPHCRTSTCVLASCPTSKFDQLQWRLRYWKRWRRWQPSQGGLLTDHFWRRRDDGSEGIEMPGRLIQGDIGWLITIEICINVSSLVVGLQWRWLSKLIRLATTLRSQRVARYGGSLFNSCRCDSIDFFIYSWESESKGTSKMI